MNMSDISDEARTRAAMQLAEWMLLHDIRRDSPRLVLRE
jgi:hypothetical protein